MDNENQVTAEGGAPTEGEAPAFMYAEGVAGEGVAPEWLKTDKYATVSDQAKSYVELEKKLGAFTGAPEEYTNELDEGLELELEDEDAFLGSVQDVLREAGVSQELYSKLLNLYASNQAALMKADDDYLSEQKAKEMEALGPQAEARLKNIADYARANLDPQLHEAFLNGRTSAADVAMWEAIINKSRPVNQSTPQETAPSAPDTSKYHEMLHAKDEMGNYKVDTDQNYAKEVRRMRDQLFPGEHRKIVG